MSFLIFTFKGYRSGSPEASTGQNCACNACGHGLSIGDVQPRAQSQVYESFAFFPYQYKVQTDLDGDKLRIEQIAEIGTREKRRSCWCWYYRVRRGKGLARDETRGKGQEEQRRMKGGYMARAACNSLSCASSSSSSTVCRTARKTTKLALRTKTEGG